MKHAPNGLKDRLDTTAFVFRGYNITNLGRSAELLEHPKFGPVVEPFLAQASEACAESIGKAVDLAARIRRREETALETYAEAAALIVAMELAQLELLKTFFGIDYHRIRFSIGYSLGEITALIAGGVMEMRPALRVLLSVATDFAELAHDTTLAVLSCADPPRHRRRAATLFAHQSKRSRSDRSLVVPIAELAALERSGRYARSLPRPDGRMVAATPPFAQERTSLAAVAYAHRVATGDPQSRQRPDAYASRCADGASSAGAIARDRQDELHRPQYPGADLPLDRSSAAPVGCRV